MPVASRSPDTWRRLLQIPEELLISDDPKVNVSRPVHVTYPIGKRIIQYDGGEYSKPEFLGSGLDRAALLALRYYGCKFSPVFPEDFDVRDREKYRFPSEATYKNFVEYRTDVLVKDDRKRCCLLFEVVYPGQQPVWPDPAANLVLYLVPRRRLLVNHHITECVWRIGMFGAVSDTQMDGWCPTL